ncbi:Hypothetical protein A7982_02272 [Minicystis rosea]|nr:Hypothetical protein A7982_02272 [Minicystis rosea]
MDVNGGMTMLDVEQAIREVGEVYQALTGRSIEVSRAELPSEIDPRAHIENRYRQFKSILAAPEIGMAMGRPAPTWTPTLEVVEVEREVRFCLDLPSVSRSQVSVAVVGEWLVVRGVREGRDVRYSERPRGAFQRVMALPPRARREGVHAALRDGVLVIAVPTDGPDGGQTIEVK